MSTRVEPDVWAAFDGQPCPGQFHGEITAASEHEAVVLLEHFDAVCIACGMPPKITVRAGHPGTPLIEFCLLRRNVSVPPHGGCA